MTIKTQTKEIPEDAPVFMPRDTYEFIDWLDQQYPHECIRRGQSLEDAHREAGARELIDMLIQLRAEELAYARENSSTGSSE